LADCHGAINDNASRARAKRTVFIKDTPAQWAAYFSSASTGDQV
jgi:hypothetical protein